MEIYAVKMVGLECLVSHTAKQTCRFLTWLLNVIKVGSEQQLLTSTLWQFTLDWNSPFNLWPLLAFLIVMKRHWDILDRLHVHSVSQQNQSSCDKSHDDADPHPVLPVWLWGLSRTPACFYISADLNATLGCRDAICLTQADSPQRIFSLFKPVGSNLGESAALEHHNLRNFSCFSSSTEQSQKTQHLRQSFDIYGPIDESSTSCTAGLHE